MNKAEAESRIKEIDGVIAQQTQISEQVRSQILMLHGAKQELQLLLKKIDDAAAEEKPISAEE